MRSIIARVAKLAKAYVIGEQRDWQTATEGNEVGDLMMVGLQLVVPAFLRLQILPRFNDNGIGQIPLERRPIQFVFVRDDTFTENLRLEFRWRRDHARPHPVLQGHSQHELKNAFFCKRGDSLSQKDGMQGSDPFFRSVIGRCWQCGLIG